MAVADKMGVEQRCAPGMEESRAGAGVTAHGRGRRGRTPRAQAPARLGARRRGRPGQPRHDGRDARFARRQGQLAAGDGIEGADGAPELQHHRPERAAGKRVGGDPQRGFSIRRPREHEPARIDPEFGEPRCRDFPRLEGGEILPHPQDRPARRRSPRQTSREADDGGRLPAIGGMDLMQDAKREAAPEGVVSGRMAESHAATRAALRAGAPGGGNARLKTADALAQCRERRSRKMGCAGGRAVDRVTERVTERVMERVMGRIMGRVMSRGVERGVGRTRGETVGHADLPASSLMFMVCSH